VTQETEKERTDRQLTELLNELRVVLPGAQVLLAFLFTVPFATRFGDVDRGQRAALFAALITGVVGTILLMAPPVYHRLRWRRGGKRDVIRIAHHLFLVGTALLALSIDAAVFAVSDFLYGRTAAFACAGIVALLVVGTWYVFPLERSHEDEIRAEE
jgi:hypothetical protein